MTKKDFQLIANVLKSMGFREGEDYKGSVVTYGVINDFTEALAATNPRFDKERFKEACK